MPTVPGILLQRASLHEQTFRAKPLREIDIERLTDSTAHCHGRDPLRHLSLNFSCCIFFQRTLVRDCGEFVVRIWSRLARQHGFEQSLHDQIGEVPLGSCGVSVVVYSETEMACSGCSSRFEAILASSRQLDDCQRKVSKMLNTLTSIVSVECSWFRYTDRRRPKKDL